MLTPKTQAPRPAVSGAVPALRWDSSVRYLKGVGPEKEKILARLELRTLGDLFGWFPRRHEVRLPVRTPGQLTFEGKECVQGVVAGRGLVRFRGGRGMFRVVLAGQPPLYAVFYNQPYLAQVFKPKQHVVFYGAAEKKGRRIEMVHPEFEIFDAPPPERTPHHGRWVPVYSLTEDLGQKFLRQAMYEALSKHAEAVPERLRDAYRQIHFPADEKRWRAAYERLVFEEFLNWQIAVETKRAQLRRRRDEIAHADAGEDLKRFLESLPFRPTQGQKSAIEDAVRDMKGSHAMNRLVQGDVGSGKTLVAASALFFTAKNGFQGALMAPTEVLAQQLYMNLAHLLEPFGIRVGYCAQGQALPDEIDVAVGTHALLEARVKFRKLGLVVIDEQHKFGVAQRALLRKKGGAAAHYLAMTATPIPRTLAMALYGDMDLSSIAEKPAGRQPVRTLWFRETERAAVYRWLEALLAEGAQAFVVCPQIGTGADPSKGARETAEKLRLRFAGRAVGLLHGRLKAAEKQIAMKNFKEGRTRILVSTTVIEVGVDVPNARFMVVENAEAFGLAQLHQLRGRVGRGAGESFCVLFSDSDNEETAQRLNAFVSTDSGFEIAEKDLAQRGSGEMHGEKQHGLLRLRIGDIVKDAEILKRAKEEARRIVEAR